MADLILIGYGVFGETKIQSIRKQTLQVFNLLIWFLINGRSYAFKIFLIKYKSIFLRKQGSDHHHEQGLQSHNSLLV